jgi:hypothetical protein
MADTALAHHSLVSAAKAYLFQIAAAAGGNNHPGQFPFGGLGSNLPRSLFTTGLRYLLDAAHASQPQRFSGHLFEIYYRADAVAAAAQHYPDASLPCTSSVSSPPELI